MDKKNENIQVPSSASKQRKGGGFISVAKAWAPSKGQLTVCAFALLALSNGFAWASIAKNGAQPEVMTVGIRQMTTTYMAQLAMSNLTPAEVAVRTDLYLSVTQDTLRRAVEGENVILIAKEAVLAGDVPDVTKEVEKAVNEALTQALNQKAAEAQGTAPISIMPMAPMVSTPAN